jgi:hypothetical protein
MLTATRPSSERSARRRPPPPRRWSVLDTCPAAVAPQRRRRLAQRSQGAAATDAMADSCLDRTPHPHPISRRSICPHDSGGRRQTEHTNPGRSVRDCVGDSMASQRFPRQLGPHADRSQQRATSFRRRRRDSRHPRPRSDQPAGPARIRPQPRMHPPRQPEYRMARAHRRPQPTTRHTRPNQPDIHPIDTPRVTGPPYPRNCAEAEARRPVDDARRGRLLDERRDSLSGRARCDLVCFAPCSSKLPA